jgi:endonuclease/exonuclease/phosphatase (EEP) superfamily protein YafD
MGMIRRLGRHGHALAWIATAGMGAIALLPWLSSVRGRVFTVVRSLMPWVTIPAVPITVASAKLGHRRLAVAAGAVAAVGTASAAPLTVRRPQPVPAASSEPLTIVHANLLFDNIRIADVAGTIARLDADVVTFSEYTPHHAQVLRDTPLAAGYPYRVEMPAALASGTALWSRHPVTPAGPPATRHHTVVGDVDAPGGPIRVVVVHAQSPVIHHGQWNGDLAVLARVEPEGPAVMTGDFNAAWWHPEFRAILANGWRDVHHVVGRGLSSSWPVDHLLAPRFIRLDHALVSDGLVVGRVTDIDIPGSDHRGLVVSVSRAT